jgi:hypothetical protein
MRPPLSCQAVGVLEIATQVPTRNFNVRQERSTIMSIVKLEIGNCVAFPLFDLASFRLVTSINGCFASSFQQVYYEPADEQRLTMVSGCIYNVGWV